MSPLWMVIYSTLILDRAWKKLATIPASNPIKILIGSQDTFLEGTSKAF
jgi:hypothetical protein